MKPRLVLAFALALGVLLVVVLTAVARDDQPLARHQPLATDFVAGEVLLKLRPGAALSSTPRSPLRSNSAALNERLSQITAHTVTAIFAKTTSAGLQQVYHLQIDPDQDVMAAIKILEADPNVEYAEPNYLAHAAIVPNDLLYASQWGLDKINAPAAWNVVTGTPGVVIAIIDSGIDTTHPDLAGRLWFNPGEIPSNGIDDDNNGYVDDENGWNFVASNNSIADDNGHGTQVAGVAGASTNNAIGIAGMCWNCRLMIVKAMQTSGVANYSDIAAAVNYAASKGAQVINLSLGGYADSATLRAAIEAASATVVIVGGAGNDNVSTPFYPAAYSNVLAVASTTISDTKASFSNYGAWVDVVAPGVAISTTFSGGDYGTSEGTSLSAPFVSGLAGLIKSQHPDWSPALVRAQIVHTTDAVTETQLGSGRINVASAMQAPRPLFSIGGYSLNGTPNGRPELNSGNALIVNVSNDWLDATNVIGTLSESDPFVTVVTSTASFGDIASGATQGSAILSFTVASGAGYNHPIAFTLNLSANGGAYTATLPLTITTRSSEFNVQGTLTNTVWTSDKTYIVKNNVYVAQGYTLTIEPGTTIKFDGPYSLDVRGTLITDGTTNQPIRFESRTGTNWGKINFADTSIDATIDSNLNYLNGSILRHVVVDKAQNGIEANMASPYLSNVELTIGGVRIYTATAFIFDSRISGGIGAAWDGYVWHNAVDSLTLQRGSALSNTVAGNLGAAGLIQNNQVGGVVDVADNSTVLSNTAAGGITAYGTVTVSGNIVNQSGITVYASAPSLISGNSVQGSSGWGIDTTGPVTITANRVVGNRYGVRTQSGLVNGNLIANNERGLWIGNVGVFSNTLTGNIGNGGVFTSVLYASTIVVMNTTAPAIAIGSNNLEGNGGLYDIAAFNVPNTSAINAANNWWGTTDSSLIDSRIFDFNDNPDLPIVTYTPFSIGPVQDAPAYARKVAVLPDTTLGIQTGTFEAEFSRSMDTSLDPMITFYTTKRGTWQVYSTANSGLPYNYVWSIAIDQTGTKWIGTGYGFGMARFDGTTWTTYTMANSGLPGNPVYDIEIDNGTIWTIYNIANSGLPSNDVRAIAIDHQGVKWFATSQGVARFDGTTWTVYNSSNSGLPNDNILAVAVDADDSKWFGTYSDINVPGGVARFREGLWTLYTTSNSGLPSNYVRSIAVDHDNVKWFGTQSGGVARFDDSHWIVYNSANSGLPSNDIGSSGIDHDGTKWFGTQGGGLAHFDDHHWTVYNTSNSGLPSNWISAIAIDGDDSKWLGANDLSMSGGIGVLYEGANHRAVDNSQWFSPTRYRATYDINTLIPRGAYTITVDNAVGLDGLALASNSAYTFTVDYAGGVVDTTPPPAPNVSACGSATANMLSARWSAYDPQSAITLYRYAIGASSGGSDVVNWTTTTATSTVRSGLNLLVGQIYYVSVQARNAGGLWSPVSTSSGIVAGAGGCPTAGFTASPESGTAPLTVHFTEVSSGTIDSRLWSFGDGITTTLINPTHVYSQTGLYTVSLQVAGPGGSDSLMRVAYITVTEPLSPPVAAFDAAPRVGKAPLTVNFADHSTGNIANWLWQFGDGLTSTLQTPTHTYQLTGAFSVTLSVTGPGGTNTLTKSAFISVANEFTVYLPLVRK
jgi:thermitase